MKNTNSLKLICCILVVVEFVFTLSASADVTGKYWKPMPLRTQAQAQAGMPGGEGQQMLWGLSYAPSNPDIVYLVSDTSQVWKSIDGGNTWMMKHKGFLANGGVSLVVSPYNENVVFVAGSLHTSNNDPVYHSQDGIYRTTDGGENWVRVKTTHFYRLGDLKGGVNFAFADADTLYAGTHEEGLLKSDDGGDSWNTVLTPDRIENKKILDVKIHPQASNILYIAAETGLYKFIDNNPGEDQLVPLGLVPPDVPRAVVINHLDPNVIYASVGSSGVYKSSNGGLDFTAVNNGLPAAKATYLAMSPVNPNRLYAGFFMFDAPFPYGNHPYYSVNAGYSWSPADEMDAGDYIYDLENKKVEGEYWSAPVAPHPSDELTALSSAGGNHIEKTIDGGANWVYSGSGYTGGRAGHGNNSFSFDPNNPDRFALFLVDFGPVLSTDGGETFRALDIPRYGGSKTTQVGALDPTPGSNLIVTATGTWGTQVIAVGQDNDGNWSQQDWSLMEGIVADFEFIAFNPQDTDQDRKVVYAGKYKGVFENGTWVWTELSFPQPNMAVRAMDPLNGNTVYSYSYSNPILTIYKSTDQGASWLPHGTASSYSTYGTPAEMIVDPSSSNRVYMAIPYRGVYIMDGSQWTRKKDTDGLYFDHFGAIGTRNISVDPRNANILYAGNNLSWLGNSNGVFRSADSGATWEDITLNLGHYSNSPGDPPEFNIWSISVNPLNSQVYAGSSHGTYVLCTDADGDGYTVEGGACGLKDCNDSVAAINPAAGDSNCDGIDNNCNGQDDEGAGQSTCGLGPCQHTIDNCLNGAAQVCDPMQGATEESCDGLDNDCDALTDEGLRSTFYLDADEDTYGDPALMIQACTQPTGYVMNNTDCSDSDATVYPGKTEIAYNDKDDDCDLLTTDDPVAGIMVDVNTNLGPVNRGTLSSSMVNPPRYWDGGAQIWRPSKYHIDGSGVWDYDSSPPRPVPEMVGFAKSIGFTYVRFPMIDYDWKLSVGPMDMRPLVYDSGEKFRYGLPEFLKNADDIGAIPVIAISEYLWTIEDAVDLVKYLNSACSEAGCDNLDQNTCSIAYADAMNGGDHWALLRACDRKALGYPETDIDPNKTARAGWNIVWFEFGNESWGFYRNQTPLTPVTYSDKFRLFQNAMSQADPDIRLGANLNLSLLEPYPVHSDDWTYEYNSWTREVVQRTGDVAGFFIVHNYVINYDGNDGVPGSDELFKRALAGSNDQLEYYYRYLNDLICNLTGKNCSTTICEQPYDNCIPIAVTEFNGQFVQPWTQEYPVPYRHSLGTALLNADHIRQLMHTRNIQMANYWQFANHYWGLVAGPSLGDTAVQSFQEFVVRPNFYPMMFYNNYFGDVLLDSPVLESAAYSIAELNYSVAPADGLSQKEKLSEDNLLDGIQWYVNGSPSETEVLAIDFNGTGQYYADAQKTAVIHPDPAVNKWYRLSGYIKTDGLNPEERDGIYLSAESSNNLVSNPGFDNNGASWSISSSLPSGIAGITVENSSLRVDFNDDDGINDANKTDDVNFYQVSSENIAVSPNTTYVIEGLIKTETFQISGAGSDGLRIEVIECSGDWKNGTNVSTVAITSDTGGEWVHVSKQFTTKSITNCVRVKPRRYSWCSNASDCSISGTVWWDDIRLTRGGMTKHKISGTTEGALDGFRYISADFSIPQLTGGMSPEMDINVVVKRDWSINNITGTAEIRDVKLQEIITRASYGAVPYLSVNASKSFDGKKVFLMVVNKHMTSDITSVVTLNNFDPVSVHSWILNGPSVDATNEVDHDNVHVEEADFSPDATPFSYTFPAHSLTGLVIYTDTDGDGHSSENDCNDDDIEVNPGASEICDGIDNDCNSQIDDVSYYRDADGDGYGAPSDSVISCSPPTGYITNNSDCDDNNASVKPGATEICDDGHDNDCDGTAALCNHASWFDNGGGGQWLYRQPVTIQAGMTMAVDGLSNFPVLIKIADPGNPVFAQAQADGDDIIFTDADGLKLDHELEKFNAVTGELAAWVRLPLLTVNSTAVYMYYGNADAVSQQNRQGVWDSSYVMVQHLSETSGQHFDSTAYGNNSSPTVLVNVTTQGSVATAKIGGADEFDGTDDNITVADADSLDNVIGPANNVPGAITIEAWIKPEGNLAAYWQKGILSKKGGGGKGYRIVFDHNSNCYSNSIEVMYGNGGLCSGADSIVLNQWQHVVYVYDSASQFLYINGELNLLEVSFIPTANENVTNDLLIGKWGSSFDGFIDEVRISNSARSAAWVQAEYNNQNDTGTYIRLATQEILCTDSDHDGYAVEGGVCGTADCNDNDAGIYPDGPPVRAGGINYYLTLQAAYDAAPGGLAIEINTVALTENLNFNLNKTLTLTGGYDCGYSTVTGKTTVNGNVTISSGKVTIENLEIQ